MMRSIDEEGRDIDELLRRITAIVSRRESISIGYDGRLILSAVRDVKREYADAGEAYKILPGLTEGERRVRND